MKRKTLRIVIAVVVLLVIAGAFLAIPGKMQRDVGIDFGRLNDRVLVGTLALIGAVVLSWKAWREQAERRRGKR